MYYVFYRLIYQQLTLESWFTNLEQVPLNNSLSTPLVKDTLTGTSKDWFPLFSLQWLNKVQQLKQPQQFQVS